MKLPNLTPSSSDIITEAASEVSSSGIKTITVFVDETDKISPYNDTYKNEDEVIHAIEKVVRTSYEYRQYVAICKTEFDLTKCKFIPQADIVDTNVGLELHHYPFTLFATTFTSYNTFRLKFCQISLDCSRYNARLFRHSFRHSFRHLLGGKSWILCDEI